MKKCLLVVFVMCLLLCGCGEKEADKVTVTVPDSLMMEAVIPDISEAPEPKNQNLLTGLPDLTEGAIGKRPVAVMINNVKDALPQYGIAQADVVFELPVEGNLTRLMALYADYTQMPDICAIRSCRYYYPAIAKGFDAFYIHWGMDPTITDYVASLNLDRYDGNNNTELFARDTARRKAGYSLEHTGYFKGTKFAEAVQKANKRTDLLASKKENAFNFCAMGDKITPNGEQCTSIHIKFGNASASFAYDSEKKIYYKDINGQPHKDGRTGELLTFENVFVLETSVSLRPDGVHKKIDWAGSSKAKGYYFSNGTMQEIRWSKSGGQEESYLKFYDTNGNELVINRGKSYIAYTSAGKTAWE